MHLPRTKFIIGLLIIFAYIGIGVFGLFNFGHMSQGPMPDCPFSGNSFSICNDSVSHVSNWRDFSAAFTIQPFMFLIFLLGIVLIGIFPSEIFQRSWFYGWRHSLRRGNFYTSSSRIKKWLSLFENSPSLSYGTQL